MDYPYEQKRIKIHNDICEICKQKKETLYEIEWRVDWFQGNCEFEKICGHCISIRKKEEEKKQAEYIKKMTPIWDKQNANREKREQYLKDEISKLGIEIKEYPNGQWSFGNIIDWWTTTGNAIHRQTKKRYNFSFKKPQEIINELSTLSLNKDNKNNENTKLD